MTNTICVKGTWPCTISDKRKKTTLTIPKELLKQFNRHHGFKKTKNLHLREAFIATLQGYYPVIIGCLSATEKNKVLQYTSDTIAADYKEILSLPTEMDNEGKGNTLLDSHFWQHLYPSNKSPSDWHMMGTGHYFTLLSKEASTAMLNYDVFALAINEISDPLILLDRFNSDQEQDPWIDLSRHTIERLGKLFRENPENWETIVAMLKERAPLFLSHVQNPRNSKLSYKNRTRLHQIFTIH